MKNDKTISFTWEFFLDLGDLGERAGELQGEVLVGVDDDGTLWAQCCWLHSLKVACGDSLVDITPILASMRERERKNLGTDFEEAWEASLCEQDDMALDLNKEEGL
jgi:hypothetical protein